MDEEPQVRGCYNITFICTPTFIVQEMCESRGGRPGLSARLVNRDKDLTATTDAHHRPVRVHAQRPGKGL